MIIETEFKTITTKHHTIRLSQNEAGVLEEFLHEQVFNVKSHNIPPFVIEFQTKLKKNITLNKPIQ